MKILFLDDAEERHKTMADLSKDHTLVPVKSAEEAIQMLSMLGSSYDLVSLDHDLAFGHYGEGPAGDEEDGRKVALFLAKQPKENLPGWIHIHSWNEPAGREMQNILNKAGLGIRTTRHQFSPTSISTLLIALASLQAGK